MHATRYRLANCSMARQGESATQLPPCAIHRGISTLASFGMSMLKAIVSSRLASSESYGKRRTRFSDHYHTHVDYEVNLEKGFKSKRGDDRSFFATRGRDLTPRVAIQRTWASITLRLPVRVSAATP